MRKINVALLFIFLFLILSSKAFAFQSFAFNPTFDSDIDGLFFYNSINSTTYVYNATCYGNTGCLLLTTNGTGTTFEIEMNQISTGGLPTIWDNLGGMHNETATTNLPTIITLPALKEGIVAYNYQWNASLTSPLPYVYVDDLTPSNPLGTINSTLLNTATYVWFNESIIIPPASYTRYLRVRFYFSTDNVPTQITIDKFKFYTYDIIEPRMSYFTTESDETSRYCGSSNFSCPTWCSGYTDLRLAKVNQTLKLAHMVRNNTDDNNLCCVFQSGNLTIARRCSIYTTTGSSLPDLIQMRDLVFANTFGSPTQTNILIKKLSTTSITFDSYSNGCDAQQYELLTFNGAGTINWTYSSSGICNLANSINNVVNLTNRNLSGTKFRYCNAASCAYNTSYISFPNFQITSSSCTCTDNTQLCLVPPNNITSIDCGDCGCKADGLTCDKATWFGTKCADVPENDTWITAIGCGFIAGTCPLNYPVCINWEPGSVKCCQALTGNVSNCGFLINSTGSNRTICVDTPTICYDIDCNIIECPPPTLTTNAFTYIALAFGSLMGLGNIAFLDIDIAMLSIIISLVVAAAFSYFLKRNATIFLFVYLGILLLFTIAFANIYLLAIIVLIGILTAGVLSGYFKKTIGGG
jgi:hypothetical protein